MAYRYIGNKTRIAEDILSEIAHLCPQGGVVADLMCGTASIAAAARTHGYTVVAADIMTFAVQHATVRLLLGRAPGFRRLGLGGYEGVLTHLQDLPPQRGFFFREYSPDGDPLADCSPRKYFSAENAKHIDAIRLKITEWEGENLLSEFEAALLHHDLIMAANEVANIAGTYGHYRSQWAPASLRPLRLRKTRFSNGNTRSHRVLHGRAEDLCQTVRADLCYLDPPYMKRQYAANYHVLETLARGDEPIPIGVSGLRDWWDQYSDFCSKRLLREAFGTILGKMEARHFLISYSEDGLATRRELEELFEEYGNVSTMTIANRRFRSNDSPLGSSVTEYLFHVEVDRWHV